MKETIIRGAQSGLRAGNVIRDTDPRTQSLFGNQQSVVVVADARIKRKILEKGKTILNVSTESAARFLAYKEKRVGRVEAINRVRKNVAVLVDEIIEVNGRIKAEVFADRCQTACPPNLML